MGSVESASAGMRAVARPAATCFHCGKRNPAGARWQAELDGALRTFCCAGCLAVAETIAGAGLDAFYRQREAAGFDARSEGGDEPRGNGVEPGRHDGVDWQRYDAVARADGLVRGAGDGDASASLLLEGMTCGACGWLTERYLRAQPGVRGADVNFATRRAEVRFDPRVTRLSALLASVARLGYRAFPYDPSRREALARAEWRSLLLRTAVALLAMMQVMMFALPAYLGEDVAPEQQRLLDWASLTLTLPVMAYCALPFFRGAWRNVRARHLGMDVPVALALLAAFVASAFMTLRGGGTTYYDSITMFVALLLTARLFELRARQRAAAALETTAKAVPATAERVRAWPDAREVDTVPAASLQAGDVVQVRPGASVPADGVVLDGATHVEEAWLTGESRPRRRVTGDAVLAGSINRESVLTMRVSAAGAATRIAAVTRLVEAAGAARPRAVRLADAVAARFVAALLLVAGVTGVAWWHVDPAQALAVTFAVLVVSCPCALSLATPAALAAATAGLARRQVLITRPDALETLARVRAVAFDKTGTLTQGRIALVDVVPLRDMPRETLLAIAAALSRASEHPLARAIVERHGEGTRGVDAVDPKDTCADAVRMVAGRGVEGSVQGREWRLGRVDFVLGLAPHGTPAPPLDAIAPDASVVALGDSQGIAAVFAFRDAPRADAAEGVARLGALWVTPLLLSGDRPAAARALARVVGIERVDAGLSPEDKCARIGALQAQGMVVAMVGDGVNDAPALARADVAISLPSATPLAQCTADVVILNERLDAIPLAVMAARRARRIMRQNVAWAIVYNAVAIPAAALGFVTPLVASVGMALSSLAVVLNASRALAVAPLPRPTAGPANAALANGPLGATA